MGVGAVSRGEAGAGGRGCLGREGGGRRWWPRVFSVSTPAEFVFLPFFLSSLTLGSVFLMAGLMWPGAARATTEVRVGTGVRRASIVGAGGEERRGQRKREESEGRRQINLPSPLPVHTQKWRSRDRFFPLYSTQTKKPTTHGPTTRLYRSNTHTQHTPRQHHRERIEGEKAQFTGKAKRKKVMHF